MNNHRETEEYKLAYREGYKIGSFQGSLDINYKLIRDLIEIDGVDIKRRMKWLCSYEQDLLFDIIVELRREVKNKDSKTESNNEEKLKKQIIEFLR